MTEYILLALILFLSFVGHNMTVVYAAALVIILKFLVQLTNFPITLAYMEHHGLQLGIIILTAAVLIPIAEGTVTLQMIIDSFKTPIGIVAIIAGLLAAISGGVGVPLMQSNPNVIPALIVGTMIGVFFFKGVAVGPLIAAGFTYFVMMILEHFK